MFYLETISVNLGHSSSDVDRKGLGSNTGVLGFFLLRLCFMMTYIFEDISKA